MKRILSYFITIIAFILWSCKKEKPCMDCQVNEDPIAFTLIDFEPAWSPDGKWIAFYHADSGNSGIYLISPNGEKIKTWHLGAPETPVWSPDAQWIAFSERAQIWKKKINGDSLTQLTLEGRNFFPSWSPDGKWIAFDCLLQNKQKFYVIFKIASSGKGKTLIKQDSIAGDIRMPNWSGTGRILYAKYSPNYYSTEIFSMDDYGENEKRLTFNDSYDYNPKFLNNKIVFSSKSRDMNQFRIFVMDADGSNLKQLTAIPSKTCDWSPDGKYIIYTDARYDNGRLWIMDVNGNNKKQLTFEHQFINL